MGLEAQPVLKHLPGERDQLSCPWCGLSWLETLLHWKTPERRAEESPPTPDLSQGFPSQEPSRLCTLGEAAVASLGVTGTLVLTLARPLATWPIPAQRTLCGEEMEAGRSHLWWHGLLL